MPLLLLLEVGCGFGAKATGHYGRDGWLYGWEKVGGAQSVYFSAFDKQLITRCIGFRMSSELKLSRKRSSIRQSVVPSLWRDKFKNYMTFASHAAVYAFCFRHFSWPMSGTTIALLWLSYVLLVTQVLYAHMTQV